jgi:hypothetical protein
MNVRLPLTYIHWEKAPLFSPTVRCLSSAFSLVALSLVAFPITASSVVFLSGPSSADQLFLLSFPTFNGCFELTTAARNFYF